MAGSIPLVALYSSAVAVADVGHLHLDRLSELGLGGNPATGRARSATVSSAGSSGSAVAGRDLWSPKEGDTGRWPEDLKVRWVPCGRRGETGLSAAISLAAPPSWYNTVRRGGFGTGWRRWLPVHIAACGLNRSGTPTRDDLWLVLNDNEVSYWYDNDKPSLREAQRRAESMGDSWRLHGVHKWIAYTRDSDEVVGRGGLSCTPVDEDWGRIYPFLPSAAWVRIAHESRRPFVAHAELARDWLGATARVLGGAGTRLKLAVLGWRLPSTSSGRKPWCRAPTATMCVRVP